MNRQQSMIDHPLKRLVDFLFSLLRSPDLGNYVHGTLREIAAASPRNTFIQFERLWSSSTSLPPGHKARLCQAWTIAILPGCDADSLAGEDSAVRSLTGLLLAQADDELADGKPHQSFETLIALA